MDDGRVKHTSACVSMRAEVCEQSEEVAEHVSSFRVCPCTTVYSAYCYTCVLI